MVGNEFTLGPFIVVTTLTYVRAAGSFLVGSHGRP